MMNVRAGTRIAEAIHSPTSPLEDLGTVSECSQGKVCELLRSSHSGISSAEARLRRGRYGPNVVGREQRVPLLGEIWSRAKSPLNALLLTLALVSYALGDSRAAIIISAIVVLSVGMAFVQEHRSSKAAAKLRAMVRTTASVCRPGEPHPQTEDIAVENLVPGDVVILSAGDLIPADLRLLETTDLYVNQSALSGEAMPVEKQATPLSNFIEGHLDRSNLCFMGSNVVSGFGQGLVIRTGANTFFGALAEKVVGQQEETAFDRGIRRFTWLMIGVTLVLGPSVFLINGITKGDWLQALLFAVAIAVGLTPEMLPMAVTVTLAKGALAMAKSKVIVKRLDAIQNLGAMDVLCTDKTGTLTRDKIILKQHVDIHGADSPRVLHYAYLNSYFQSGLKNLLDVAVLEHGDIHEALGVDEHFQKIGEIPFDFSRRRLSVIVSDEGDKHILICKGAVEEMFAVSTRYEDAGAIGTLDAGHLQTAKEETVLLNKSGFRVVAVAYKEMTGTKPDYGVEDESDLILLGYISFLDPPKESASEAIAALEASGVRVKILTGDNEIITRKICGDVGIQAQDILLGPQLDAMADAELTRTAASATVFAKLTPGQKQRIVRLLRESGHVVGFLGDGINDGPALKSADVGVSVDSAVDIARESADIILLEKNLLVLREGVIEGRKVFANITKYIRMGASSNFGNMFSVLGASILLPFMPLTAIQVLTNNLLYDLSQTAIPTDTVDEEYVASPRRWDIAGIFRFMLVLGPVSSIFDYLTFAMMLFVFKAGTNPALFQTGWFVESLLTQTLIIHVIRTARIPFIESSASPALATTSLLIAGAGIFLPLTGAGSTLGFVSLPLLYWPILAAILFLYAILAHLAKVWFFRRWGL
ncbi:magnesium-translocating P-type ATPase [Rhizobium mesoamericanum]|uniref:Magnesium-transporting ATPase, P-type 1 n=1 Tax=Rhizobium mesoamericanum STM3625 TaxID=1211777 RepID=K0PZB8_9HYPH|nr:magnesium-translocating P-type ATPase [Rhizobium mesoamericanum]CCM75354.1 magnesium transporter [Rhizobium mesoamericanum STM3625]